MKSMVLLVALVGVVSAEGKVDTDAKKVKKDNVCWPDGTWYSTPAGKTAMRTCHNGVVHRECSEDGVWGEAEPCKCSAIDGFPETIELKSGSKVCDTGNTISRVCDFNGVWTQTHACDCPHEGPWPATSAGDNNQAECVNGQVVKRWCSLEGLWTEDPTCDGRGGYKDFVAVVDTDADDADSAVTLNGTITAAKKHGKKKGKKAKKPVVLSARAKEEAKMKAEAAAVEKLEIQKAKVAQKKQFLAQKKLMKQQANKIERNSKRQQLSQHNTNVINKALAF